MKYSLVNVKTGIGHDLAGVQADIKRGNQKVTTIADDGFGGPINMHWLVKDENKKEKYTEEIRSFCEQVAEQNSDIDFLNYLMKEQMNSDDGLWVYLFEHLLKLWEDAQNVKSMKPNDNQVVWLVKEENPSSVKRGNSYLSKGLATDTAEDIKQYYENKGKKIASVRELSGEKVVEI